MRKLFLVGCPRSGTTWLQIILGSPPDIVTVRETHLFDTYVAPLLNCWSSESTAPHKDGLRVLLGEAGFEKALRAFCDVVFDAIEAENRDAEIVLEKSPGHLRYHRIIKRLYPDALFLHLVRDPRAVVASYLAVGKEKWGAWASKDVFGAARQWRHAAKTAKLEMTEYGEGFLEIRYEDLMGRFGAELAKISDWLKISPQSYDPKHFSIENVRTRTTEGEMKSPNWENRQNFFRRGTIDGWKTDLSEEQIIIIEGVCGGFIEDYGYSPCFLGRCRASTPVEPAV